MRIQNLRNIADTGSITVLFLSSLLVIAALISCEVSDDSSTDAIQSPEMSSSNAVNVSSNSVVIEVEEIISMTDEMVSGPTPTPTLTPVVIVVEEKILVSD